MNNQDDKKKELPEKLSDQPQQLTLLQTVTDPVVNTQSLRLWDSLVNAVFDDRKVVNRVAGKFLDSDMRSIEFEGKKVDVLRYPARVGEWEDQKEVFPMKRDYKVLEALIKLAVDQEDSAFYSGKELVLSVRASYYKIYQVFKQTTGKASFSYKQIEEAIDVLSQSIVAFRFNDLEVKGPLISYITTKDEDLRQRSFVISFHPLISRLILNGSFREANLLRILEARDMFTAFLYKKFVHNFKQASNKNYYHFATNLLCQDSCPGY